MAAAKSPSPQSRPEIIRHRLSAVGITSVGLFVVTSLAYFSYRIPLANPEAPVLSMLLLAAEGFGLVSLVLHIFSVWTLIERRPPAPLENASADIFITTWNEPVEMLRNTLLAAKKVRLARDVWLLDDGARAEMRALAERMGVKYLSRTDRAHAKAGNLNNALKHTDADFIAQFDCDHAPSPDFFEKTLGYFKDPKLAFVQTPQDFYNIDSFQHRKNRQSTEFWHEQTLFYRVIQPGKDFWNAAFFCGSCAIIRRAALDDIGGFATGTVTEDIHTSLKLHKKGWRSAYHAQSLAFGVAPANLDQYDTQRLRWGRGAMQVWRKEGLVLRPGLSLAQRLCYFTSIVTYFEGWQKAILYFMPMVVLATGAMPIIWTGDRFIELFALWLLSGMLVNETAGRGYTKTLWMEEYNCLRFFTFINSTLALFMPVKWRFRVTPKQLTSADRLLMHFLPQALIIVFAGAAAAYGIFRFLSEEYLPLGAFVANIVWASVNAFIAARAVSFSLRKSHQRRASHRFAIPAPAIVNLDGAPVRMIADDLSAGGMRLLAPKDARAPEIIEGKLLLPNGPLSFSARRIRSDVDQQTGRRIIRAQFDWENGASPDRLNTCLFGNALQWAANDWRETSPLDFTWRHIGLWFRRNRRKAPENEWRFGELRSDSGDILRCLVQKSRREPETWRALAYERPPSVNGLSLDVPALGITESDLHISGSQVFPVDNANVFVIVLRRESSAQVATRPTKSGALAAAGESA